MTQTSSCPPELLTLTSTPFPGGLAAVIYTDALQTVIMLVGALTLMGYSKWGPRPRGWVTASPPTGDTCSHHWGQHTPLSKAPCLGTVLLARREPCLSWERNVCF